MAVTGARTADPPLLTGGGVRGLVGTPEATQACTDAIGQRLMRIAFASGRDPGDPGAFIYSGTFAAFLTLTAAQLSDAEARIPGLWVLEPAEVARRGRETRGSDIAELMAERAAMVVGPSGIELVPRSGEQP